MAIHKIDHQLCTGCRICVSACPVDVIRMDEKARKAVIQYPEDCMVCEWCAKDCPEGAITVTLEKCLPIIGSWQ